jgi:hypothetical protein
LTKARQIPATKMDFPTLDPAPCIIIALVIRLSLGPEHVRPKWILLWRF